jgi:hypothetical protein
VIAGVWRLDSGTIRPLSSLGNRTPEEAVAEEAAMTAGLS